MSSHYLPKGSEWTIPACTISGSIIGLFSLVVGALYIVQEYKYGKSIRTKYSYVIITVSIANSVGSLFYVLMYFINDAYLSKRLSIGASLARGYVIIMYLFWMSIRTEPFLMFHPKKRNIEIFMKVLGIVGMIVQILFSTTIILQESPINLVMRILNLLVGSSVVSLEIYFVRLIRAYSKTNVNSSKSAEHAKMMIIVDEIFYNMIPLFVTISAAGASMILRNLAYSFIAGLLFFFGSTWVTTNGVNLKRKMNNVERMASETKTALDDVSIPSYGVASNATVGSQSKILKSTDNHQEAII